MPRGRATGEEEPEQPDSGAPETTPPPVPPADDSVGTDSVPSPMDDLFGLDPARADDEQIQDIVNRHVASEVESNRLASEYNVLILYENRSLTRSAANRIYRALAAADQEKPVFLILSSTGGDVAPAYFIAKLCREHTKTTFEVAVPRRAKSAATLICCGADKIHMGSLSELGPIDPQFGAIPALALKHSIEHLAELVGTYPAAKEMFSDYLSKALRIEALGFFERVAESAAQYAVRLLNARLTIPKDRDNEATAKRLVYAYKDHGFVIDWREAAEIFGDEIVIRNSEEYAFANTIVESLDFISWVCGADFGRDFSYVGGPRQGCWVWKRKT